MENELKKCMEKNERLKQHLMQQTENSLKFYDIVMKNIKDLDDANESLRSNKVDKVIDNIREWYK